MSQNIVAVVRRRLGLRREPVQAVSGGSRAHAEREPAAAADARATPSKAQMEAERAAARAEHRREPEAIRSTSRCRSCTRYTDYREMLDKQKDIDGDHRRHARSHARGDCARRRWMSASTCTCRSRCAGRCTRRGISRRRPTTNPKIVTQMGNQGHSTDGARTGQEYIAAGAIGEIREVHVWTNRPLGYWPQGIPRPAPLPPPDRTGRSAGTARRRRAAAAAHGGRLPVPDRLAWDLFLGVGAEGRIPPDLSPVQLARLGRLGPGRARRHGRAPHRSSVLGLNLGMPTAIETISTPFNGATYPSATTTYYEFAGARQHARGQADVVRRRVRCRRSRKRSATSG